MNIEFWLLIPIGILGAIAGRLIVRWLRSKSRQSDKT
jgi:hypothetical protein